MRARVRRATSGAAVLTALAVLTTACGGGSADVPGAPARSASVQLALVAYSSPQPGFKSVIAGFEQTPAGANVSFTTSYGASSDQSRKVARGLPTDLVSFSVQPDMQRVVDAGAVSDDWDAGALGGVPFGSVVSLVVRKGNPKNIHTWSDLLKPGVQVVTPDPLSSGSAMWNLLAPYAAASDGGANPQAGLDFVRRLVTQHIKVRPASGRAATDLFLQGTGDVLISYENEAIFTKRSGKPVDYVDPPVDLRIENPFAVTENSAHPDAARAFETYMYSPAGQRLWAKAGFRPVDPGVAKEFARQFPQPQKLWTVADLGGWDAVYPQLFAKDTGAISKIYTEATG